MIQLGGHFSNEKLKFLFGEPAVSTCFMQFDENGYDEWMIYIIYIYGCRNSHSSGWQRWVELIVSR